MPFEITPIFPIVTLSLSDYEKMEKSNKFITKWSKVLFTITKDSSEWKEMQKDLKDIL